MDDAYDDLADMPAAQGLSGSSSSRRGGKDKGKGRGRAGAREVGGGQGREVQVSKALSKLLRHDAEKDGVEIDEEGFARVQDVLQWPRLKSLKTTFADIQLAVTDNAKQRFAIKVNPNIKPEPPADSTDPRHWLIRANQGHSIAISSASLLTPITIEANNIPHVVVHGTYGAFYPLIVASGGLKKMTRNHVHFSKGLPEEKEGVISGMRSDAEILIYIDVRRSLEEGAMKWWLSDNGVVLSEGDKKGLVGTRYWMRVEGRKQKTGILWQDGVEVAQLPEGVQWRRPPMWKEVVIKRQEKRGKRAGDIAAGLNEKGGRTEELEELVESSSVRIAEES